jgi:tetratricopeptide (TPR) repeat protein
VSKETRTFKAGETLYAEGDASDCAYLIVAGRVELLKAGRNGAVRVGVLGKGELLGEMGVLDQGPRNTSARADSLVKVEVIPRADFLQMIESEPQAAIKIMTRMAKRLRDSDEKLADAGEDNSKSALLTGSGSNARGSAAALISSDVATPAGESTEKALVPLSAIEPQSLPVHQLPSAASLQRPGLFDRLVGVFRGGNSRIRRPRTVAVTALSLEAEYDQRPYLIESLGALDGLILRPSNGDFPALPEGTTVRDLRQTRVQAGPLLSAERADLLIWGGEDSEGRVIQLRFTNKNHPNMDQPGFFPQDASLVIPGDFDESWTPLLRGAVMAAAAGRPSLDYPMLPLMAEQAAAIALQPPASLTPPEQASVRAMFAHVAAQAGVAFGRSQLVDAAIQCYQAALPDLPREAVEDWASLNRALGLLLAGRGEKTDDEMTLRRAAESFTQALGATHRDSDPENWGNLQARLAGVWFRVDMVSGDSMALKEALTHYQAALTAFPKARYPWRWADIMTAIGQVLQVYGDHLKSVDILRKAVEVCDSALEIRTAQVSPLLYASTRNNMGSALFLLARHTQDSDYVRQASEAFLDALAVHRTTGSGGPLARTITKNLERAEAALGRIESRQVAQPTWAGTGGSQGLPD